MNVQSVDGGSAFDFGKTSEMYAQFRDIYPPELYEKLYALGVGKSGTRWLDLGTGTGVLPLNLYMYGAEITGTDVSAPQIEAAKALAQKRGADVRFLTSPAESLPFPDGSFDCVTAAQCFWYFDRERVVREIRRVLKPGGIFTGCFYVKGSNAHTDKMINAFYVRSGFFTPPFETVESLQKRLSEMYSEAKVRNVQSIAVFQCRK